MTDWAEQVARDMVNTHEGRPVTEPLGASDRPAWATARTDAYPQIATPAAPTTARAANDRRSANAGRAGSLTPLQACRTNGGPQ